MVRDGDRISRIHDGLREAGLDGLAWALPANVLLLTGYWPVVGTSVALAAQGSPTLLLVPEDERGLAAGGWADAVYNFRPGSLKVEPVIYVPGLGGGRHCDMVAVTGTGVEVLSPFQAAAGDLVPARPSAAGAARGAGQ